VFDASSKSLGVALLDFDQDGWPDLLVANDTQPNKLYKNLRNGRFRDVRSGDGDCVRPDGKRGRGWEWRSGILKIGDARGCDYEFRQ